MMLECPSSQFDPETRDKEWKWKEGGTDGKKKADAEKKVGRIIIFFFLKKGQMVIQREKQM